jgi:hypothetical protein
MHEFSSTDSKGEQQKVADCWVVDVPNSSGKKQHRFDVVSNTQSTHVALAAAEAGEKQRWLTMMETKQEREEREAEERKKEAEAKQAREKRKAEERKKEAEAKQAEEQALITKHGVSTIEEALMAKHGVSTIGEARRAEEEGVLAAAIGAGTVAAYTTGVIVGLVRVGK